WLLLFDGKTFFGWEAEPLIDRRPLGVPDPKISIARGKMSIETEIPIRVRTLFTPVFPWSLEFSYTSSDAAEAELMIGVPSFEDGKTVARLVEIPLEPAPEPKTIVFSAPALDAMTVDGFAEAVPEVIVAEKGLTLVMTSGKIEISSCRFRQKKTPLFDSESLTGWKTSGEIDAAVLDGDIQITGGPGSLESENLFSDGVVSFEFRENVTPCNSGLFFRTVPGSAMDGYECQMNNAPPEEDREKFLGNDTGSIFRRAAARRVAADPADWTAVSLMADGNFFRTWVNGIPTLVWTDERKPDDNPRKGLRLEKGSLQFQGHDPSTDVLLRNPAVAAVRPDEADALAGTAARFAPPRASDPDGAALDVENAAFLDFEDRMNDLKERGVSITDFHIHLRGGMTAEKALLRQDQTGIGSAVLENAGREWPLSDNEKIAAFIDEVEAANTARDANRRTLAVGLQVNDRDWYKEISPENLARLDYILADSMMMGTDAEGKPQRLWLLPADYRTDLDAWMEEYMDHCRRILDEPITIFANPTYLPKFAEDHYDELWTDARMDEIIDRAAEKGIALEIQAESPFPNERFLRKALERGAKISFGTNNFDPVLKKLDRWDRGFEHFDLNNSSILQKEEVLK
ncbi:MAG: DUF1080 domain-containing protein, partial [Thermoguttaceae bacterium]|nr:DUF1080 domain-containing protein [Thermoguttaceae bacterium]